ncbi:craniofacial development protein 1 [Megalops cyprinoides]|uniref:craniofacial development protein 1 n=1 Tax=Megalops cyprinoides TaxID=118141 RepID=UPI001863A7F2|nr:craniofacial development protein 1 [Megalops cyprinoides]
MNYSDYDSENYSSDEDADYVPSEDNLSEDDMNECEKEEGLDAEDAGAERSEEVKKKRKKSREDIGVRKRKKGGLKLEEEEEGGDNHREEEGQEKEQGVEEDEGPAPRSQEDREKKKSDDLWASFLSDVGPRPKPSAPVPAACSPQQSREGEKASVTHSGPLQTEPKPKEPSKITITKVFDFAGEEVRVTKEVEADSKEAKSFLKMKEKEKEEEEDEEEKVLHSKPATPSLAPGPSAKRPVGLGSVLNRISGKKQKMSTLEKSRLDWDAFKTEEGITDELATHNRGKEGYIERKNFLERVDHRQFELEKNLRLSNMKR